jgi:hypothetical protein
MPTAHDHKVYCGVVFCANIFLVKTYWNNNKITLHLLVGHENSVVNALSTLTPIFATIVLRVMELQAFPMVSLKPPCPSIPSRATSVQRTQTDSSKIILLCRSMPVYC